MSAALLNKRRKSQNLQAREVWIVEDDPMQSMVISRFLKSQNINCRVFNTASAFKSQYVGAIKDNILLLMDYFLDEGTAIDLIQQLKREGHPCNFLVMTGHGDQHIAVEIMKEGALDFVAKTKAFVSLLPFAIEQAFYRMDLSKELLESRHELHRSLKTQKRLNAKMFRQKKQLEQEQQKVHKLLINVLPEKIAGEILAHGTAKAKYYSCVSVLFADVENFSAMAARVPPIALVQKLDEYFCCFDKIIEELDLEKIKTIGDCYMCAGGIPEADSMNAFKVVVAGLQIRELILQKSRDGKLNGNNFFDMRIGIHTGEVVAGVLGSKKFAYDIWGDAANTASLMVQSGGVNQVNVSRNTYNLIVDFFVCTPRGQVPGKNNKQIEMFFVERLNPQFAQDANGVIPNALFWANVLEKAKCS